MSIASLKSAKDVASILGLGVRTIYNGVEQGIYPHRKFGARILFSDSDIQQIIEDAARPTQRNEWRRPRLKSL